MQDTTQKCADRIDEQLKDREAQLAGLMSAGDDDSIDELFNLPLGIDTVKETTITLSWGGPADYLHIVHADGEIKRLTYRFSDWYDTAIVELDETSPLWDYVETYILDGLTD